jgi:hypothetical protein
MTYVVKSWWQSFDWVKSWQFGKKQTFFNKTIDQYVSTDARIVNSTPFKECR